MKGFECPIISLLVATYLISSVNAAVKLKIGIVTSPTSPWRRSILEVYRHLSSLEFFDDQLIEFQEFDFDDRHGLKKANSLLKVIKKSNVSVVVGPYSDILADIAQTISVPYLVIDERPLDNTYEEKSHVFFMQPSRFEILKPAVQDTIRQLRWKTISVIYDDLEGLSLIGYLLTNLPNVETRLTHFDPDMSEVEFRQRLIYVRQQYGKHIIVACRAERLSKILDKALELSLLSYHYHWLYATIDPEEIDLQTWADTGVNLTAYQLLQNKTHVTEHSAGMTSPLDSAICTDTMYVIKSWYNSVSMTTTCNAKESCWISGKDILKVKPEVHGTTGKIQFNERNKRTNLTLKVVGLNSTGLYEKGLWRQQAVPDVEKRLQLVLYKERLKPFSLLNPLGKGTLAKVVTILEPPFVMLKEGHQYMRGNERYEGYLVDMLQEIAEIVGFEYELYEVPDGKFGSQDQDGNWNGMVRELMIGNATISLATMSISSLREQVIDFSKPFKDLYISILIKRPKKERALLQFLTPLDYLVWILILLAFVLSSVLMLLIDKMVPNNKDDPEGPRYNLKESLWFFYGSLVQAGSESTPRTFSGRILGSAWWFFSLILVSSYTANLAAFLTVTKISTPIKQIPDLAGQTKMRYGTVKNSRTADFFKDSNSEIMRKMWVQMSQLYPDNMVESSRDGIAKVESENYAFLWDLPVNLYTATQNCDTMVVGGPFDRKHYGLGVPRGAAYRDDLTMAILQLNEQGRLLILEKKWWSTSKCGDPRAVESNSVITELEIDNVAGVFVVLAFGVFLALTMSVLEKTWWTIRSRRKRTDDKVTPSKMERYKRADSCDSGDGSLKIELQGKPLVSNETSLLS